MTHQGHPFQEASAEGYKSVDGNFVRRKRDHWHDRVIGYDDIDQLFWYSEGIVHIALTDKVRLIFIIWTNGC